MNKQSYSSPIKDLLEQTLISTCTRRTHQRMSLALKLLLIEMNDRFFEAVWESIIVTHRPTKISFLRQENVQVLYILQGHPFTWEYYIISMITKSTKL